MCGECVGSHCAWSIIVLSRLCVTSFLLGNFPNGDGEMGVYLITSFLLGPQIKAQRDRVKQKEFRTKRANKRFPGA